MTWNPIFPAWLVILATLLLGGFALWALAAVRSGARRAAWAIRAAVVLLIGIACLRPGIGSQAAPTVERALDVVFVVDTTASMVAEDWGAEQPRMAGAKADIMALAEAHPGARFALITFDAQAVQRMPFTADTSALQAAVDALEPEVTRYSQGSSIGAASALLEEILQRAKDADPSRLRVAYYLGDGEQTASREPESFAPSAELLNGGAVLGYGTAQGGRMRETTTRFATAPQPYIQDPAGGDARSIIDEARLQTIAAELGVGYQHREEGAAPAAAQADAASVPSSTRGDVERAFDLYWIFAIAAFLLLLADVWRTTRALLELGRSRGALPDD